MVIVYVILAVIQLMVLVYYFTLCANVKKIKEKIHPSESMFEELNANLAMGCKKEAADLLVKIIAQDAEVNAPYINAENLKLALTKYDVYMNQLSLKFDDECFIKLRDSRNKK